MSERAWTVQEYRIDQRDSPDGLMVLGQVSGNIGFRHSFDDVWGITHLPTGGRILDVYGDMRHALKIANEIADLSGWESASVEEIRGNAALGGAIKAIWERERATLKDGE